MKTIRKMTEKEYNDLMRIKERSFMRVKCPVCKTSWIEKIK
jgi:hypothetical protein